jgi:hypothetical protein
MDDECESRAFSVMADLGFAAAEIAALHGQLAQACARRDRATVLDLAQDLVDRHDRFHEIFIRLLVIGAPALGRGDYSGLHERTSV